MVAVTVAEADVESTSNQRTNDFNPEPQGDALHNGVHVSDLARNHKDDEW